MDDRNLYGKAIDVDKRGRAASFKEAIDSSFRDLQSLMAEKNEFFDTLVDRWPTLFPALPVTPGRFENGIVFLYVRSAPQFFLMRPRLPRIRATLASLPGAPKKIQLRLEIHAS